MTNSSSEEPIVTAPLWRQPWRNFQDPYLGSGTKFPSPFESFVSGFESGRAGSLGDFEALVTRVCRDDLSDYYGDVRERLIAAVRELHTDPNEVTTK